MTQKDKKLLLKDLCARLPYGVKVEVDKDSLQNYDNYWNGWSFDEGAQEVDGVYACGITLDSMEMSNGVIPFEFIKPYLFPLSSMTDEQAKELQEIIGSPKDACIMRKTGGLELWLDSVDTDPTIWLDTIFEIQDWLNKHHFDWRGLIPMGLAIDATGKNIY